MKVPFLVSGPGVKAGVKNNQLVKNIDSIPTWVELAEIKNVRKQDRKSMIPLLTDHQLCLKLFYLTLHNFSKLAPKIC